MRQTRSEGRLWRRDAASSNHHRNPSPGWNLLAIRGNDCITVCTGGGGDITGTLPVDEFDCRVCEFAGESCGEEARQPRFYADFRLQTRMEEFQRCRCLPCQGFEHGSG